MQLRNCIILAALMCLVACKNNSKKSEVIISKVPAEKIMVSTSEIPDTQSVYRHSYSDAEVQRFVTGKKKTVITGRKGLKVTVDPSVLEKVDGSAVNGKVTTRIIEITDSKGLFRNNAATLCDDRLLASGGSYFIEMSCNGQQLRIKQGKKLMIDLPRISEDEMELFYGQRSSVGNMNWTRAGNNLTPQIIRFNRSQGNMTTLVRNPFEGRIFGSLKDHVYLYSNRITVAQLIDSLNKFETKVKIDTLYMWPKNLPKGIVLDTNFLLRNYGPMYAYRMVSSQQNLMAAAWDSARSAKYKELKKDSSKMTLEDKLSKYYLPEGITQLGWINCDRFYETPQTDIQLYLPITFNNSSVEYFIVYRSFMGMVNGRATFNNSASIPNVPVGEKATLITFIKSNGRIHHGKKDFVVEPFAKVKLEPEPISDKELKKMFGAHVSAVN